MTKGIVKWFSDFRGYGFIDHDEGDVFVHYTQINLTDDMFHRTLDYDDVVDYELHRTEHGLIAKNVTLMRRACYGKQASPPEVVYVKYIKPDDYNKEDPLKQFRETKYED